MRYNAAMATTHEPESIYQRMERARRVLGLSKSDVARAVGISQPSYTAIEAGRSSGRAHLPAIAEALGMSPEQLIYGDDGKRVAVTSLEYRIQQLEAEVVDLRQHLGSRRVVR